MADTRSTDQPNNPGGATSPGDAPERSKRRSSPVWFGVLIATMALLMAGIVWYTVDWSRDNVQAGLLSWDDPVDDVIPVTIEVDRPPGTELVCELVALDDRFVVVGQLTLEVPASQTRRERVDAEIPLRGDGIVARLHECVPTD